MEEKLELKHLAPYLPYGVKFDYKGKVMTLTSLNDKCTFNLLFDGKICKPLLHPLDRLTIEELKEYGGKYHHSTLKAVLDAAKLGQIQELNHSFFEWLVSKHYDVNGLIPKGLALPIDPK